MNDNDILVRVENVSKKFCRSLKKSLWYGMKDLASEAVGGNGSHDNLRDGEFWAVKDVSFELRRGECLGLIGRNGAGKTTLLKMLNGLIKPDAGRIEMRGRVGALIALGAGFNPILTGRENIYVNGSVLGLSKKEIDGKIEEIIGFADIRDFIDSPVQSYSSGMQVRLGFAIATALDPDVLLLDEVLAVGDAAFRNKCYRRVVSLRKKAAVIFVSHNMEQVGRVCDHALALSRGGVSYSGPVAGGVNAYETLNDDGGDEADTFLSLSPPITSFAADFESTQVRSGSQLKIHMRVEALQSLENFSVRIVFYNAAGAIAADGTFASEKRRIEPTPGASVWQVTLDSIPLKNGKYRVSFNLIDSSGDLIVWSHKVHAITVFDAQVGGIADCQLRLLLWDRCG